MLRRLGIANINLTECFGSEAQSAYHCRKYPRQNLALEVLFIDVVARALAMLNNKTGSEAEDLTNPLGTSEQPWPAPGDTSVYACGFVCTELSKANKDGTALNLDNTPETHLLQRLDQCGQSQRTLMASLVTIKKLLPKTFLLENVGGCPASPLLAYIKDYLSTDYFCFGNLTNAADFGTPTERYRLSIIGIFESALFASRNDRTERCVQPRIAMLGASILPACL